MKKSVTLTCSEAWDELSAWSNGLKVHPGLKILLSVILGYSCWFQIITTYQITRPLKPGPHDSISIRAKQKAKQRNEVKPAT